MGRTQADKGTEPAEARVTKQPTLDPIPPRPPRRMKQPVKAVLREQLALAADEIERQRITIEHLRTPWWRRLWRKP